MNISQAENVFQWLLTQEDCDEDNRRFYCSYLIAHTSLSMADAKNDASFFDIMHIGLASALEVDKLSEDDKSGINTLWQEACTTVT
ncbi:MAG: hypothetical protein ACI9ES_003256 [Oceanospirillaceae bacterium]|jgi:hypothetical protein